VRSQAAGESGIALAALRDTKLLDHSIRRPERAGAHGAPAELEPKLKLPAVRSERSARERVRRRDTLE